MNARCALLVAFAGAVAGTAGQAQTPPKPPIRHAPARVDGFVPSRPGAAGGQSLVPPPHASGSVIAPPEAVDRGLTRTPPPGRAFPTPMVRPAPAPPG